MDEPVLVTQVGDDFVGEITLNRPGQMNTFTTELARALLQAFEEMDAHAGVRAILLKGSGKAFCAGIDVNELPNKTAMEYQAWIERMEAPLEVISRLAKPVIAQVHGVAAANGAGLVAAADLAIASEDARLGLTAINVGLNCVGPVVPVARSVGRKRALELLLYGELIPAREAMDMGLINRVVPTSELATESRKWAQILAAKSPIAVQIAKKAYYAAEDMDYHRAFAHMNEAFARLCTTRDAREGVGAFLERRSPEWKEC